MNRSLSSLRKVLFASLVLQLPPTNDRALAQSIPSDAWRFDFDGDGIINAVDLLNFSRYWKLADIPTPTSQPTGNQSPTPTDSFPTPTPTQMEIPPYFNSLPPTFGLVGEEYTYVVNASDPNGDPVTFSIHSGPNGMVMSGTGLLMWTPIQSGSFDVTLGITDGKTDEVYQEFEVHVGLADTPTSSFISHLTGGVIEVTDLGSPIVGARIEVEPFSLPEDATVAIRAVSDVYEYVPEALPVDIDGLTSGVTATIELPYDPNLLAVYGGTIEDLVIVTLDPLTGEWIEVIPTAVKVNKLGIATVVGIVVGARVAYVATHSLYLLNSQPRRIEAVKGSLVDFFTANSSPPKRRLVVIHGVLSAPNTFTGPDDFLSSTGNSIQQSLFEFYDSIVAYRYPSGLPISRNALLFQQRLVQGYHGIPANSIFSFSQNPSFKFDILGHSMGGLISRYAVEKTSLSANLRRLITLGTPHGGFQTERQLIDFVFGTIAPDIVLAPFPGIADLLSGSSLLSAMNNGTTTPNVFSPPEGQQYYSISGRKSDSLIPFSDGVVTESSALFLKLSPDHERRFGDDEPEGPANENYSHSNLHALAGNDSIDPRDRVGDQVLLWFGASGVAPGWTPTPTIPGPTPTSTPTLPQTIGPRTEPIVYSQYQHLIHVAKLGSDISGDGSAENPWASIAYALSQVNSTNAANRYAILVSEGTYAENGLGMKDWVDMYGGYAELDFTSRDIFLHETVVNGGGLEIILAASSARLDGFTLTGGSRGIHADSVSSIITNNTIRGNTTTTYGAGIYCEYGSPYIRNNLIEDNSAAGGAGIYLRYCTNLSTVEYNLVRANTALGGNYGGGGMCILESNAMVLGNHVFENSTEYHGGGIYCNSSSAVFVNNIICYNLTDDITGDDGGGLYAAHSEGLVIVNCSFWGNRADNGGGVYVYSTDLSSIVNTIVYGNQGRQSTPQIGMLGIASTIRYCNIEGLSEPSNSNISSDPLFVSPGDYDFHITGSSPCIDQGVGPRIDPEIPEIDIDGDPRGGAVGGRDVCDIGADEYVGK